MISFDVWHLVRSDGLKLRALGCGPSGTRVAGGRPRGEVAPHSLLPYSACLLVIAAVLLTITSSSFQFRQSVSPLPISLDNFNTMSNSSWAGNIRTRDIFNMKREFEYKTPAFMKNQSLQMIFDEREGEQCICVPFKYPAS